ncbi:hypothetical protein K502DRAFT_76319 [Neoconidiobolus thromboides FSU 785]|nr:hypothetical protein K502DRAFT_76319 [Neoconidiobolus thromboides FSU 785]
MNGFINLLLPLLLTIEVYTLNCPKPTDSCQSGYSKFLFSDPKAPQCWSQSYNGWQCNVKQNGKCNEYNGQVDIGNCKQPVLECPKVTDYCVIGDIAYGPDQSFAPKCWFKTSKGWACDGSVPKSCDANKGQVDVTTCKFEPRPPVSECPKLSDSCLVGDIAYHPDSPNAPKCWKKSPSSQFGWSCRGNDSATCDSSKGEANVKSCNSNPPIPLKPGCPKYNDTCIIGDIAYLAFQDFAPKCWYKSSVSSGWSCQGNSDAKCDASKGQVDRKTCKLTPPTPPVLECPKASESCKTGDIIFDASSPNAPKCWTKTNSGWSCEGNSNTKCDTSKGQVDIKSCNIPLPPLPDCPKAIDSCYAGTTYFKANDPKAPKCWSKSTFGSWMCLNGLNGKCDSIIGQIDITTCKITPPNPVTPECPTKNDYCRYGTSIFYASNPRAPVCWSKSDNVWSCTNKNGPSCQSNQAETSLCFDDLLKPKCPDTNEKCYDSYGRSYTLKDYSTPRCWTKSSYGWKCRNSYGKCGITEVDVKTC